MKCVYDLYRIANKDSDYIQPLYLWNQIYQDFYAGLSDLTDEQIKEDFYYYLIHDELYKNTLAQPSNQADYSLLTHYSCWAYNYLLSTKVHRDKETQKRIKEDLYDLITSQLLYGQENVSQEERTFRIQELCYLLKVAINAKDTVLIENHFFNYYECHNRDEQLNLALVIILIYLYYLAVRETLKSGKEIQDYAKELLRRNREFVSYFFYELDILLIAEKYKVFIDSMLHNWEQMDEGIAKSVVIIDAIDDFFMFTICAQTWNKDKHLRMLKVVEPNSMFPIYQRYFAEESKQHTIELFDSFCKLFAEGERASGAYSERLDILEEVFNERYHQETIQKGYNSILTEDEINAFNEKLCVYCSEFVEKNLSRFHIRLTDDRQALLHNNDCILLYHQLPNSMIRGERIHSMLSNRLETGVMQVFLDCIIKKIEFIEVESSDNTKQKCLIDMVTALGITPTIAIGHRDTFWGEEDEHMLQKYTEGMEHLKFCGGYNCYFILDGKKIEFCINNIRIEYADVEEGAILNKCQQRDDGKYYYNITNDIYIPFEKDEVVQYVQNTQKVIKVLADVSYRLPDAKIGAGIQIIPNVTRQL